MALTDTTAIPDETVAELEEFASSFSGMTVSEVWETIRTPLLRTGIILVAGYFLVKILSGAAERALKRSRVDASAHYIILSSLRILLWLALLLTAAAALGIPTTSTLAIFSVFALAISLAVKDGLAHFAGGIMILASKPFSVGDTIESRADDVTGTVTEIGLIHTKLRTVDNKQIYVPNGVLIASTVINYTGAGKRRLDITFQVAYPEDFRKAQSIIAGIVEAHPMALKEPAPVIRVAALGASGVDIICRIWVEKDNYEALKFDLLENVKLKFDEQGVEIPFPQMDVHIRDGNH